MERTSNNSEGSGDGTKWDRVRGAIHKLTHPERQVPAFWSPDDPTQPGYRTSLSEVQKGWEEILSRLEDPKA